MPLGGDYDLLGPFPGRTASGHGMDINMTTSVIPKFLNTNTKNAIMFRLAFKAPQQYDLNSAIILALFWHTV